MKKTTKKNRPKKSTRPNGLAKGAKRSPAAIEVVTRRLFVYIKKHPGKGIEAIGPAIGQTTKELVIPMRRLVAAKRVRRKGMARGKRYWANAA